MPHHGLGSGVIAQSLTIPGQQEPSGHHACPEIRTQGREMMVAHRPHVVERVRVRNARASPSLLRRSSASVNDSNGSTYRVPPRSKIRLT